MSNLAHFGSRVIKLTHPNKGQKRQSSLWFHYWRTCGLVHIFTFIIENSNKDWIKVSSSMFQIIWFWICFHQKILSRSRSGDAAVYSRQWQIEFWDFARANFYKVRKWEIKRISSFLETFSQKKTFCGFLRRLEYIKNNFKLKSEGEICEKRKYFALTLLFSILAVILNDVKKPSHIILGRRLWRPNLKAKPIFAMFESFFFTYLSASLQRHLTGTPNIHSVKM